jgi:hypothetical protein
MKVTVEQRGGIAGPASGVRTGAELSGAETAAVKKLIANPPSEERDPGGDRLVFHLSVEDEDGKVTELKVPESAMPEVLAKIPEYKV